MLEGTLDRINAGERGDNYAKCSNFGFLPQRRVDAACLVSVAESSVLFRTAVGGLIRDKNEPEFL